MSALAVWPQNTCRDSCRQLLPVRPQTLGSQPLCVPTLRPYPWAVAAHLRALQVSPASRLHGRVPGPVSVTQGMQRTGLGLGPLAMAGQQQLVDAFAALDPQDTGVVLPQDLVKVRQVQTDSGQHELSCPCKLVMPRPALQVCMLQVTLNILLAVSFKRHAHKNACTAGRPRTGTPDDKAQSSGHDALCGLHSRQLPQVPDVQGLSTSDEPFETAAMRKATLSSADVQAKCELRYLTAGGLSGWQCP